TLSCSGLDGAWLDEIGDQVCGPTVISAPGLLMFFRLEQVEELVRRCALRFPGELLVFDAVPARMVSAQERRWGRSARRCYQPPQWQWGLDGPVRRRLADLPGVAEIRDLPTPRGRGPLFGLLLPVVRRLPGLAEFVPAVPALRVSFEPPASTP